MPGIVVDMDAGAQNGARTDHDRDPRSNGVHDGGGGGPQGFERAKNRADAGHGDNMMNGGYDSGLEGGGPLTKAGFGQDGDEERQTRMNDLPDEISHVTQGYIPLAKLLMRLAQLTHNALQEKVAELARMPAPSTASLNGNAAAQGNGAVPDDTSPENLAKKDALLTFAQAWHTKWVKALVITDWSRKAEHVSKLIDLKTHIDQQRRIYDEVLDQMIAVKRGLIWSRLPNPDLKTALQVLSTGQCTWMPELGYIEPPAMTPEELLKWIDDLNTLLAIRLNLDDFDKIPFHFRNYTIESGRVTFKVEGEFEVDLTIADEDPEKQFWFIDFRFAFSPAASTLSETLRVFLEARVNEELAKDGLLGCYRFLHEFVLTHKINELKRQAAELTRNTWTNTLVVEPLNRALAVQYWKGRYNNPKAPKSWILIGVKSNRKPNAPVDPKTTSSLSVAWYRSGKEVKDADIPFDTSDLSAETLLKAVIARHVEFILKTIHDRLAPAPRFAKRESAMALHISKTEPIESSLTMQFGVTEDVKLMIEPITGMVAATPHSRYALVGENRLNFGNVDPAEDGVVCLEIMRKNYLQEEFNRTGNSLGWATTPNPLQADDVKKMLRTRENVGNICFQRQGWDPKWFVMVALSLNGDEWWLFDMRKSARPPFTPYPEHQIRLPLNMGQPDLSDEFWNSLTIFVTGMICRATDMSYLHDRKIRYKELDVPATALSSEVRVPAISFSLSDMLPSMKGRTTANRAQPPPAAVEGLLHAPPDARQVLGHAPQKKPWAYDVVEAQYRGLQAIPTVSDADGHTSFRLNCVETVVLRVVDKQKFRLLSGHIDEDVSYKPRSGEFQFLIRHDVGGTIAGAIETRVKAIDRIVDFLAAMAKVQGNSPTDLVQCQSVSLQNVMFTYAGLSKAQPEGSGTQRRWKVELDMAKERVSIRLEDDNPHLRVLDLLQALVNEPDKLKDLTRWLPHTLSLMMALDKIEATWLPLEQNSQSRVKITAVTLDCVHVSYVLPTTGSQSRTVDFKVALRVKTGGAWWHVKRIYRRAQGAPTPAPEPADDDITPSLKAIWENHDESWIGLSTGATARPDEHIETLLLKVDDAVRAFAPGGGGAGVAAKGEATAAAKSGSTPGTQGSSQFSSQGGNRAAQGPGQAHGGVIRGRPSMAV